ncbi:peptide chain release factor N(5)-glutamine methyltransferase [Leptobacterium sp. I13]|uniref:peptide chain release factor N(5)-glutamine methyltransferase n=1 Tax=Leptobacterium meishanense TaxID=3128904 RepID=UPI0030EC361F
MKLKVIQALFHKELDVIYETEEVNHFFYMLAETYTGIKPIMLVLEPEFSISKEEENLFFEALACLKEEKPIQYILGKAHFYGLDFIVNNEVLIPRPETEELVKWIIEDVENKKLKIEKETIKILDIGTGSGCIAIALAKSLPETQIFALDISQKALEVAKKNTLLNDVTIKFIEANILEVDHLTEKFDVIVSNPPYVRITEKKEMKKNVAYYEPHQALFVTDNNPLIFYEKIAALSVDYLKNGGQLYFEINQYLGNEMISLLEEKGFVEIQLQKDLYGNNRMVSATKTIKNNKNKHV